MLGLRLSLLAALVVVLVSDSADGIKCYDGVVTSITNIGATEEECDDGVKNCKNWGITAVGGWARCGDKEDRAEGFCQDETHTGVSFETCYCNTDLCNSPAGKAQVMAVLLVVCSAVARWF